MKDLSKQNIIDELIEMGLTVEEIQKTYERYIWYMGYYPDKVKELESKMSTALKIANEQGLEQVIDYLEKENDTINRKNR